MKVAILHPWFLMRGGGEYLVDVLADMYPDAAIYALFVDESTLSPRLRQRKIHASILNSVPLSSMLHRHLMPLYPLAVETFDLRDYDLVISSCGPAVMGANVRQDAMHICYCHTPQRSWWDLYAEHQMQLRGITRHMFVASASFLRTWEFSAMQRVDKVIANSNYIAGRVRQYFRRDSTVIYPPVHMGESVATGSGGAYYLSVCRLEKQKRIDILIHACNRLKRQLKIAGVGKEEKFLKAIAGPTIEFLGWVPNEQLPTLYANSKAFLFAADEDFGIAPVEAQSYGRPVIAYGHGGSLETVRVDDPEGRCDTGVFFPEQTIDSLIDAMRCFEVSESAFLAGEIQHHARKFCSSIFIERFRNLVDATICERNRRG